ESEMKKKIDIKSDMIKFVPWTMAATGSTIISSNPELSILFATVGFLPSFLYSIIKKYKDEEYKHLKILMKVAEQQLISKKQNNES
ncbi:MAG: hypothetical protein FWE80_09655, partial [Oscillospiraceae bacterium]|nr:hypothetical protein [Oscillospiraceae bacterium]